MRRINLATWKFTGKLSGLVSAEYYKSLDSFVQIGGSNFFQLNTETAKDNGLVYFSFPFPDAAAMVQNDMNKKDGKTRNNAIVETFTGFTTR